MPESRARVLDAWWAALQTEPALGQMFAHPPTSRAALAALLEGKVLYAQIGEADDGSVTLGPILWGTPVGRGLQVGLWVPPAMRRTRRMFRLLDDLVARIFQDYPVLIGGAYTPALQQFYEHYGLTGVTVPHLGPHGDAWIGWLTPETWTRRNGGG